jgi:hypothetical protein
MRISVPQSRASKVRFPARCHGSTKTSPFFCSAVFGICSLVFFSLSHLSCAAVSIEPIPAPASAPYPIFLGGPTREWSIFEGRQPAGSDLRLKFNSKPNTREHTLFIRQDDVKQEWTVTLNGRKLGALFLMEADLVHTLPIPSNLLREGENELHLASKSLDDIFIHSIAIGDDSRTNILRSGALSVRVNNPAGQGLPSRITIVDTNGTLAALRHSRTNLAVRPGVIYTPDGTAEVNLLPGKYTVYATRGPEYSLAKRDITVDAETAIVPLALTNEVDTKGWISSDTHIHTLALSKHGDSLLHERAITLAAEHIDLPIATEHNLHADYTSAARDLDLARYFTTIPGNEVTTTNGHFNIFPVSLSASPVDHTKASWPDLLARVRQSPGVRFVILNHPTDTHAGFIPFAATNLNPVTGKNLRGDFDFTFDGVELVNSGAMRTDWMEPIRAWFALLNRGSRIVGIGSSDCHDVSRFIVGQGRTYIQGDDSDPGRIDIQKVCETLKQGRSVVSLGLFPQLRIADAPDALDAPQLTTGALPASGSGIGDLHTGSSKFFEVTASMDFLAKRPGQPLAFKARFPKPKADTWYVLVADMPGVTNAYWSIARPYQPSSPEWNPAMIGVTNPIWLDADGDGRFTPPRVTAKRLLDSQPAPQNLINSLADYDWATAAHVAELLHDSGTDLASAAFQDQLQSATPEIQQGFTDYIRTISK